MLLLTYSNAAPTPPLPIFLPLDFASVPCVPLPYILRPLATPSAAVVHLLHRSQLTPSQPHPAAAVTSLYVAVPRSLPFCIVQAFGLCSEGYLRCMQAVACWLSI